MKRRVSYSFQKKMWADMTVCIDGAVVHLQGDLSQSGVTPESINSLDVSFEQLDLQMDKTLRIDCSRIQFADNGGLQLLYTWMQCARFRGFEPALVNLSTSLQLAIKRIGVGHCFADALA